MSTLINIDKTDDIVKNIFEKKKTKLNIELGNILEAEILKNKNGMYHLSSKDNFKFKVPAEQVKGSIGDTVMFEIINNDNYRLTLRQLQTENKQILFASLTKDFNDTKELFKKSNFIKDVKNEKESFNEKINLNNALANIRSKLSYSNNNLNKNAINELVAQGISLDKIDLNMLTSTIKEIKALPDETRTKAQNLKNLNDRIINSLNLSGLPITDKNVTSLSDLVTKTEQISKINDLTIKTLISREDELTIDNIYKAKFASYGNEEYDNASKDWEALISEVKTHLTNSEIEISDENLDISKFLFKYSLPITKENIDKTMFLKNINKHLNINDIINQGITNITQDQQIADINIYNSNIIDNSQNYTSLLNSYKDTIKMLPAISLNNIAYLIKAGKAITLEAFKQPLEIDNSITLTRDENLSALNTKLKLLEIQLKLTTEASQRLSKSNININLMPLENALNTLKEQERQYYISNNKIMNFDHKNQNIDAMQSVFNKVSNLNMLTNNVFSNIILNKSDFTIEGINNSILTARADANYEMFETVVNRKYGDSFSKVQSLFTQFLENMGVEPTDKNIKAASILSKNNMEVNYENLLKVKIIDIKIENIYNRLHPAIVASMLHERLNPEKMHIDEVLNYIDKFDNIFGENLGDKISSFIFETDKSKVLNMREREAMIAVYRMLNNIQKEDSISLGLLVKNNTDLTLGNMLKAANHIHTQNIDIKINEGFGMLEKTVLHSNNINSILSNNINELSLEYNKILLKNIARNSNPEILAKALNSEEVLLNKHAETFNDNLIEISQAFKDELYEKTLNKNIDKAKDMLSSSPMDISWLEQNNILPTLLNIKAYRNLKSDPFAISQSLEDLKSDILNNTEFQELPTTKLEMLENGQTPINILDNIYDKLDLLKQNETNVNNILKINELQNNIRLQNLISLNNRDFKIPVKFNDKISSLNVYVLNDNLDNSESEIFMSLKTQNLGVINMIINITDDLYNINIKSQDNTTAKYLMENKNILDDIASNLNLNINSVKFTFDAETHLKRSPSSLMLNNFIYNNTYEFTV